MIALRGACVRVTNPVASFFQRRRGRRSPCLGGENFPNQKYSRIEPLNQSEVKDVGLSLWLKNRAAGSTLHRTVFGVHGEARVCA